MKKENQHASERSVIHSIFPLKESMFTPCHLKKNNSTKTQQKNPHQNPSDVQVSTLQM